MKNNHTKKVKYINNKTLIVTLDIGKMVHYGYMRTPTGEEMKSFPFDNVRKGSMNCGIKYANLKERRGLRIL